MKIRKILLLPILLLGFTTSQGFAALASSGSVYLNAEQGSYVGGRLLTSEVLWTHGVKGIISG